MTIELLISVIILLVVCGMLVWCVRRIPGLPEPIPIAIEILIVLAFAVMILNYSGLVRLK